MNAKPKVKKGDPAPGIALELQSGKHAGSSSPTMDIGPPAGMTPEGKNKELTPPYEWSTAFDQIEDPVFIHDKNFRILQCNAAYAKCAGQAMEAIIGKPYWQVFPRATDPLGNCIEPQDSGETQQKTEFTSDTGEIFLTRDITVHLASGDFWYSRHMMENITQERVDEEVEKEHTSFSDAIIGSAPGLFFVLDEEGKFVRWNANMNRLTGLSDEELKDAFALSFVAKEHKERMAAEIDSALTTGYAQGAVAVLSQCDGSRHHDFTAHRFERAGKPYLAIFCCDNTEIKQLENDLFREKVLADTIIESAPGAFFLIDEKANLVRWNRYLSEETGLTDPQLKGSSILNCILDADRQLAAAKFLAAFATGYAQMEVRVPTADHGIRVFLKTARRFLVDGVPYVAGFCLDVTDRRLAEEALVKEKLFSDALIDSIPGAFFVVDMEGNYYRWNSYLNRLTGLGNQDLKQRPSLLTIEPEDWPLAAATMKEAFEQGSAQAELHIQTRDRGRRLFLMTSRRFQVLDATYLVGVGLDTTDQFANKVNLPEHDAQTDPLTRVANRGHFIELAQNEFERCRRYGHPLSVWVFDIDHFKTVNDIHGHHTGDLALQSLVQASRKALRDWDIMGRMGGEEFAVLLPDTDCEQALLAAERLRQTVAAADVSPGDQSDTEPMHVTVSMGIATVNDRDADIEELLNRADHALNEAQRSGYDKVCIAHH